jgi:hypothetical protein
MDYIENRRSCPIYFESSPSQNIISPNPVKPTLKLGSFLAKELVFSLPSAQKPDIPQRPHSVVISRPSLGIPLKRRSFNDEESEMFEDQKFVNPYFCESSDSDSVCESNIEYVVPERTSNPMIVDQQFSDEN